MNKKTKPTKITPNKIKDTEKTTFTAREVAVLVENLENQFKLFGEKIQSIDDKIDGIPINQARTLERITIIEIKNILKSRVDPADFKIIQTRVTTLEKQVELLLSK